MYNVAPYVERCILSLENQDIPKDEYEIICINDGSPDNCKEIIEGLQKDFKNIILINQENQGVSRARNNGINNAGGEYILFIDPDDYVDANTFKSILNNAFVKNAEVSILGFTFLNENGIIRDQILNQSNTFQVYSGHKAYYLARGNGQTDPDRMVGVLFKTAFINNYQLRYLENVPYLEDGEFIARILCLAQHCIFDGRSFYQRTTRTGSATNSNLFYTDKAMKGFLLAAINLKKFQEQHGLSKEQRTFLNQPICKFVFLTLGATLHRAHIKNFRKTKKQLLEYKLKPLELKGIARPYIYYARVYNNFFSALIIQALVKESIRITKSYIKRIFVLLAI